jgi:tetratricopeptide (TPR) repeat protein
LPSRPSTPGGGISRPGGGTGGGIVPKPGDGAGAITRPGSGLGDRPGISGGVGNRPSQLPAERPGGIVDRPSQLPTHPDRPGIVDRPDIADRPGAGSRPGVDRPPVNVGDRTIAGNANNVNINRWASYSGRAAVAAHPVWSRPAYWNKRWYANRPAWYWGRAWYRYHWTWHHGYWNYWRTPPAVWFAAGMTIGWLSTPEYTVVYNNPYWVESPAPVYDYSQPIPAPDEVQLLYAYPPAPDDEALEAGERLPTTPPPAPEPNDEAKKANNLFGDARDLFKEGKYAEAQAKVDQAIKVLPSDATLHEFRSLTLFAQGKYKDAAAALYAVLAAGPGWDWETMKFLYGNDKVYTEQLRALEEFVKDNPKAAYGHLLLAYEYLVLGSKDPAIKELEEVVRLQPEDKLSAGILKGLKSDTSGSIIGK